MTPFQKQWVDTASYEQLLRKWRFEEPGSSWFSGECGDYYVKKMKEAREKTSVDEQVEASKSVGWEK